MRNLLKETLEIMQKYGKTPADVHWIGLLNGKVAVTFWDVFAQKANKEYYEDFGGIEVSKNLTVVGNDWWLERHEYDGSEWWEYKELPKALPDASQNLALFNGDEGMR